MVERISWTDAKHPGDVVRRAVDLMQDGRLAVFPTDSGYAAVALAGHADAAVKLARAFAPDAPTEVAVGLAKPADLARFVNQLSVLGRRLAERCWPGPVTLAFPIAEAGPSFAELPAETRAYGSRGDQVAYCMPGHAAIAEALRIAPGPLLLTAVPDARTPVGAFGPALDAVDFIVDDGEPRYHQPSTKVLVEGGAFRTLEAGVVSAARLQRLANEMIAFVCSGNTCRSPMAEALAKTMLAKRLGCSIEQLDDHGFTIVSAGLAASPGAPASEHARTAVNGFGADLADHAATRLTTQLALAADRLYVMTRDHLDMIRALWPGAAGRASRLCGDRDVSDPFGGPLVEYERCAAQMAGAVERIVEDWLAARA